MEKELPDWLKRMLSTKELKGKEYEHVWTLLQLIEPVKSSNNQRTWTDEYELNGKRYNVTYGLEDTPIIEEITG
jgi:hypothetical protein